MAGVLTTANLGHALTAATVIESLVAFMGLYGIHEVANDQLRPTLAG